MYIEKKKKKKKSEYWSETMFDYKRQNKQQKMQTKR